VVPFRKVVESRYHQAYITDVILKERKMSAFKVVQGFTVLPLIVTLTLTGCSFFGSKALAPEEAQIVDTEAVVEREGEAGVVPTSAEEATVAEEPAPAEPVEAPADASAAVGGAAPVEEKVVAVSETAKEVAAPSVVGRSEVAAEAEGDYATGGEDVPAVAATPLPLPTASPSLHMADTDAVAEMAEVERADEASSATVVQQNEPLKAGEVDDNAQWDDYLLYRRNYRGPRVHDRDISERYVVEVIDGQGRPVLGANVRFFLPGQERQEIYSAHTYAAGQVLFQPLTLDIPAGQIDRFTVEVQKDNVLQQFSLARFDAQIATDFTDRWTVTLDWRQQPFESLNLDVLFLVDATGSMADEIAKIQSTIFDVSARIDALPENPNVRYGLVTYRDRGDSFVTRSYEFTPDVRDYAQNLNTVFADGGGDYPESLNEGLHDALHSVEWRGQDTVQLIFLIADAPPHLDYAQDYDYAVEMENAARRGIKIFPIASSGLDDQGEYSFRQIAQYPQGRFIFLTYEGPTNSGAPGEVTTHHVDDYSVENLDDLLVGLVEEELAYQSQQYGQGQ
jgi:hypothetical protein